MIILPFLRRARYEPIEHPPHDEPVIYGARRADYTPDTIAVIRRNAGRIPAIDLADAMGWRLKRLRRVARAAGIDLRYPPRDSDPRGA